MNSGTQQHTTPIGVISMPSVDYTSVTPYSEISPAVRSGAFDDTQLQTLPLALHVPSDTQRVLDTVKIALSFMAPPEIRRKQ
ncbi:hypothetical protein [Robbsia sp. KACC 23696]|uniref:hypothetical protein n=1 Tax=Robbsia sp. KACC 23696 TaxID=3149231 RepID=UPI00325AEC41